MAKKNSKSLEKRLLIEGLIGVSPFPIVGEVGMYMFLDSVLENSSFKGFARKGIAASTAILTRLYGIYPLYVGAYDSIQNFVSKVG